LTISRIRIGDIDLSNAHLAIYEHKKAAKPVYPVIPKDPATPEKVSEYVVKKPEYLFSWGKNQYGIGLHIDGFRIFVTGPGAPGDHSMP
jgi:hypothetical protein